MGGIVLKKLIRILLIFLGVFTVLSLLITYFAITKTNNRVEKGIDLYGTYDQNDLLINELVETYKDVEIKIPKIDGLKDSNVEKLINKDIYNRVYGLLKGYSNINYANFYTRSNFANTISISYHVGSDTKNEQIYLNYNLVTGKKLKLEDLFIKNADITGIVRSGFYKALTQNNRFNSEGKIAYPNEDELYKVVKGYLNGDKKFAFSASEIDFYYKDVMASVKMVDIADKVSIYTKYLTEESLYKENDIGYKNLFTCARGVYDIFEKIEYGYLEDNFWYDVTIWKDQIGDELTEERAIKLSNFKEGIYQEINEKINKYREIAKSNPDKFYILLSKPNVNVYSKSDYIDRKWHHTYSDLVTVYENINIFEMPISLYEDIYKDKLINAYRYEYFEMGGGVYLDTDANDGATVTKLDEQKLYNYITGEEVLKTEDVFYEGSGYVETIKEKTKENLIEKYNYSETEVEELLENINYELDGTQVNVTIPNLDNFMTIIYFDRFDESMMKIF